ncbi:MAG TPA: alpha/beta hydrolase [Deltaproteobacteria bacterium]|nr:alpha/beta hydrolase [Deltaproteobacteria bacterium]
MKGHIPRLRAEMGERIIHTGFSLARANSIEIAYDTFGDAAASPLILIMGLSCKMIMWEEAFCSSLAARGFRVVRFDNRDMGMPTKIASAGWHLIEDVPVSPTGA